MALMKVSRNLSKNRIVFHEHSQQHKDLSLKFCLYFLNCSFNYSCIYYIDDNSSFLRVKLTLIQRRKKIAYDALLWIPTN
jgi:cyclopropane fatty-acyl-phospholipid synthase-like methyltransferase